MEKFKFGWRWVLGIDLGQSGLKKRSERSLMVLGINLGLLGLARATELNLPQWIKLSALFIPMISAMFNMARMGKLEPYDGNN